MKIAFLDTENDGLNPTFIANMQLHVYDADEHTTEKFSYRRGRDDGDTMQACYEAIQSAWAVVAHNMSGYDEGVLRHIAGMNLDGMYLIDTMILSRVLFPDRKSHSLGAWGRDFGYEKGDFDMQEWLDNGAECTDECILYCERDVDLLEKIFWHMHRRAEELNFNLKAVHDFEYKCQQSVDKAATVGFELDIQKCKANLGHIEIKMQSIRDAVYPELPVVDMPPSAVKHPPEKLFKNDGTPTKNTMKYFDNVRMIKQEGKDVWVFDHPDEPGVPRSLAAHTGPLVSKRSATFDSLGKLKEWLVQEKGWEPLNWNKVSRKQCGGRAVYENTTPKFFDDARVLDPGLLNLGVPWITELHEYMTLRHRKSLVEGWLGRVNTETAIIETPARACGARTARMTHIGVANVPRATSYMGKELRGCLGVPKDALMVGWDASALEACMEAHEVADLDPGYAAALTDGTLHDRNAEAFGVSRDAAKTLKYAMLYGASPKKVSVILGCRLSEAKRIVKAFWDEAWALKAVKEALENTFKAKRFITGIDGRPLFPGKAHTVLNTKLQSSGAIVMKTAMLLTEQQVKIDGIQNGYEARRIIAYHDEEQYRVQRTTSQEDLCKISAHVGQLGVDNIKKSGIILGMKVNLEGEYKVGKTWADTH